MLENKIEDRLCEIEETRMWVGSFLKKYYTKFTNVNTDSNENVLELSHIMMFLSKDIFSATFSSQKSIVPK